MPKSDWDIILEDFNYNTTAIAQAIHDIQGKRKNFPISRIRSDIQNFRFNQYTGVVLFLLQLHKETIEKYQRDNPAIVGAVDIGIAVQKMIEALEPVTDTETTKALIRADADLEYLINLIYAKLGGGKEWVKVLKGI